ncbi:MAG: thioredoxin family protein [Hyphomicrobiaceae bacterium]
MSLTSQSRLVGRRAAIMSLALGGLVAAGGVPTLAAPKVGASAPEFSAVDSNGRTVKLSDYRGKVVVLEWTNDGCPYVGKHYGTGNMQKLQAEAAAKGVVWLSVISSAPGTQGYVKGLEANKLTEDRKANPTAVLLDPKGTVGRLYDARTTPHMYIVDKAGMLAYAGAIDDKPSANHATINGARNYVREALDAVLAGKPVSMTSTRPYGCSVKYQGS